MPCGLGRNKGLSDDPEIRQVEKRIAGETKIDQRGLDHAMHDMKKEEKALGNAKKAADRAQHDLDKAIAKENKTAGALNNAQRLHETAVVDEQNAEKELTLKRQYQQKLEDELQKRKGSVNEYQHTKDANDQFRETKLSEIHADAASRAGLHANSIDRGPFPAEKEKESGSQNAAAGGSGSRPYGDAPPVNNGSASVRRPERVIAKSMSVGPESIPIRDGAPGAGSRNGKRAAGGPRGS